MADLQASSRQGMGIVTLIRHPLCRLSAEEAKIQQLDRCMAAQRRELARADAGLSDAAAPSGSLAGEHSALQAAVVNELKVRIGAIVTADRAQI